MVVKREGIAGVSPLASSVSSVSSQLRHGTPAPLKVHPTSRVTSGVAPVQFNGAPVPDLNRTPRSGDSCPGATNKKRQLPEESMLVPRILFDEMAPTSSTMDDPAYWKDQNEKGIEAMIFGGGFVGDDGAGTGPHDEWAPTQDAEDIDDARFFSTQPTQPTPVCVDDFEDAPTESVLTTDNATKKKGESHRTQGFIDDEDKCLCDAWLATSHDCINGAHQKGKVYWTKVMQKYNETKMHPPYHILSPRTEESLRKRWNYIKQETSKFCSAVEHTKRHPVSRALERFNAVHKKSYHMIHCWDKYAQKWKTSFAAYDEAVKNGTAVNLDGEYDDHDRQARPPRPRGHKATKADLAREAEAIAFTQSLEKMMAENHAALAAIGTRRGVWKKRMDVEAKKADAEAELRDAEARRMDAETKTRAEDTRIMLADLSSVDDDTGTWFMKRRTKIRARDA
ncbi:hypothetical protein QYE76_048000 [Lolium multiflorum]|uniref:No apical meristem-associated C-terminal domain-containing protein n=1 Tax=Lolium multiflorum TaxID=4521 RepID=A0AAD8WZT9_LOLMU|nr:hypothetical protein QYE76_048000 [Lolium multiflorum]